MTLIIQKPTGAKLVMAQTYVGTDDPDAAAYITAVEAADTAAGQSGGLETATKVAIHSFVKGCKNDGIWPAIKASCILAGARTLTGALVPLVGAAPTKFGSDAGWSYNRKLGLEGNGTTNYLASGRLNNADPQNNAHRSIYISEAITAPSSQQSYFGSDGTGGSGSLISRNAGNLVAKVNDAPTVSTTVSAQGDTLGLKGVSRSASASYSIRSGGITTTSSNASGTPTASQIAIFARDTTGAQLHDARLTFYSIGESLNLALLDARVTDLINAFAAAIP
jgi:hypothetical protein